MDVLYNNNVSFKLTKTDNKSNIEKINQYCPINIYVVLGDHKWKLVFNSKQYDFIK